MHEGIKSYMLQKSCLKGPLVGEGMKSSCTSRRCIQQSCSHLLTELPLKPLISEWQHLCSHNQLTPGSSLFVFPHSSDADRASCRDISIVGSTWGSPVMGAYQVAWPPLPSVRITEARIDLWITTCLSDKFFLPWFYSERGSSSMRLCMELTHQLQLLKNTCQSSLNHP